MSDYPMNTERYEPPIHDDELLEPEPTTWAVRLWSGTPVLYVVDNINMEQDTGAWVFDNERFLYEDGEPLPEGFLNQDVCGRYMNEWILDTTAGVSPR